MDADQTKACERFIKTFRSSKPYSFNFVLFLTLFVCAYYGFDVSICTGDWLKEAVQSFSDLRSSGKGSTLMFLYVLLVFCGKCVRIFNPKQTQRTIKGCIASNYQMLVINVGNGYSMELPVITWIASNIFWENKMVKKIVRWVKNYALSENIKILARTPKNEVPISKKVNATTLVYQPTSKPEESREWYLFVFYFILFYFILFYFIFLFLDKNNKN